MTINDGAASSGTGTLASASASDAVPHLAVYADRHNSSTVLSFGGTSALNVTGTIYAANGAVSLQGGPGAGLNALIVVDTIMLGGNPRKRDVVFTEQVSIPPTSPGGIF